MIFLITAATTQVVSVTNSVTLVHSNLLMK